MKKKPLRFLSIEWKDIGEFRYGQANRSFTGVMYSHLYNFKIIFLLSFFKPDFKECSLAAFTDENLSETDRMNLMTSYSCEGLFKFTKRQAKEILADIEAFIDQTDKNIESWQNNYEE